MDSNKFLSKIKKEGFNSSAQSFISLVNGDIKQTNAYFYSTCSYGEVRYWKKTNRMTQTKKTTL